MNKKIKKYKIILCLIFALTQIYIFKPNISFAQGEKTIEDGIYVIKSAIDNNYVLDIEGASTEQCANVLLYTNNNANNQKFSVKYLGDGYYTIAAVHSNRLLDVANGGKTPETNVWQVGVNNTEAQKWYIKDAGNGYYNIISRLNGLYLDIYGGKVKNCANIQVYTGHGGNEQKFKFEKTNENSNNSNTNYTKTIEDGTYTIKSALNNNYVLDVEGASTAQCANILLYQSNNANNQKFNVKYIGDGYYTIAAVHSNRLLDVANGGKTPETNVWQVGANNTEAQKWYIKDAGNGYYNIISKLNGLYLDVYGGQVKNCANIQVYTGHSGNGQKFKFEKATTNNNDNNNNNNNDNNNNNNYTKTIEDGMYTIASALDNNYVLDIEGASADQCANVLLYQKNNSNNQKFNVKYIGDGYYTITAVHSNRLLDVANGGKTPETNVWQVGVNNTEAQKWYIKDAGNGYYNIISRLNGLYLDIYGGKVKNCANIQVYTGHGGNEQKFKFEKTTANNTINIDTTKYPGYKEKIEALMNKHPNWNFQLLYTGLTFDEVIAGEYAVHSRNLVPSTYGGEWICSVCGTKLYDSGWYCTSPKAIAYYMDPRNFLDETNVFQFQDLNGYLSGVCTLDGIQSQVNGTFLQNYAKDIDTACKNQNVNSYYIVTRIIQEQGRSGTSIGKGMDGGDGKTYYNPFNIGASGNGWDAIYANALETAKKYDWDSMEKAIEGGITFCKKNWLDNYQNTLYQNKFDIDTRNGTNLYEHQYMQNLMGAYSEARLMKDMYSNTNKVNSNFTFIIPVYEKMSSTVSELPKNNSELSPINVKITAKGGLNLRQEANDNAAVLKTIEEGEVILSVQRGVNSNWQKVITNDGTIGYMSGAYLQQVDDVTNCNYTAKVTTNDGSGCYIRVGPSTRLDKLGGLTEGTSVKVIEKGIYNNIDGFDWCRIQLSDGRQAYMPIRYLK